MTQEEAKALLPIIQAYSEGKTIEYLTTRDEWVKLEDPGFNYNVNMYRIKLEPKYRPFKNADECFEEMKKHEPFGWITLQCGQKSGSKASIIKLTDNCFYFVDDGSGICHNLYNYEFDKHFWLFADGTPFGIKVEEESK